MSNDAQATTNTAEIAMVIRSNAEIKDVLAETNKSLNALVQAQVRTEERQAAAKESEERLWTFIEKVQEEAKAANEKAEKAQAQALSNAKWINFGVAIATGIAIFIGNQVIGLIGVDKP